MKGAEQRQAKPRPVTVLPKWQQVRAAPRPQIPLLLWLLLALLSGELMAAAVARRAWLAGKLPAASALLSSLVRSPYAIGAAATLLAVTLAATALRRRAPARFCLLVLLMLACGATLGTLRYAGLFTQTRSLSPAHYARVPVRITEDSRTSVYGSSVLAAVTSGRLRGLRLQLSSAEDITLERGQELTLSGVPRALVPDAKRVFLLNQGVVATMELARAGPVTWQRGPLGVVLRFRARAGRVIRSTRTSFPVSAQLRSFLCGALLGDKRGFEGSELQTALQRTGLIHLLSVSGSHLALLAALCYFALRCTRLSRRRAALVVLVVAGLYTLLTGCEPTTVRALGMLACALLALLMRRRADVLSALALSLIVMLLADPLLATSLSVQLSLAAVAGIVCFGGYFGRWLRCLLPRAGKLIAEGFGTTIAANLAVLPFSAALFGVVSLAAPLANLLLAPLFTVMLVSGLVGIMVCLVSERAAQICFRAALMVGVVFEHLNGWLSQQPWSALTASALPPVALVALCVLVVLLWSLWVRPTRRRARMVAAGVMAVIVLVAAVPLATRGGQTQQTRGVVVLNVGQGDALLVRDAGHTGLIDTGPSPTALKEQLRQQNVTRLDFVLFTHGHADHIGGASALDRSFHITHLYVSQGAQSSTKLEAISARLGVPLTGLLAGQSFMLGRIKVTAIWPRAAVRDPDANESCLTTLLADELPDDQDPVPTDTLLTSGDAEEPSVRAAVVAAGITHIDVLKAPHHGSAISLSDVLLNRLTPEEAVISCGLNNRYGHPKPVTLQFLQKHNIPYKRTDLDGAVVVPF
ncbi:MAG: DNA internalization-related competence protein ComEC/Rec2 [Coriobacteriia bacterium]|nr:DNA internalization-related competence protein ComEC/Rec2 [Coriobacteriia bacterium]